MKILIVEDDKKVAGFISRGLREEQHSVDVCFDGEEALNCIETEDYDMIILDVMIPKLNGFEVVRRVRRQSILTPILLLTAKSNLEDKLKGLDEGADDYLTKPFSFEELLARIRALLRRSQDYRTRTLKVADLELDPISRRVTRNGVTIPLTGKEYALLEYLLRNRGRIVTHSMIIDHVWDRDFDGFSNVVNVYINHLRDKIDKGHARKYIQTIRGMGYKIDEEENI
jgi:DNA-binding response OmpR family regulator